MYSKERSHCLETNKYVVAKKVATEKLPEEHKDLLVIDEEAINDESCIERNVDFHENYMEALNEIRAKL